MSKFEVGQGVLVAGKVGPDQPSGEQYLAVTFGASEEAVVEKRDVLSYDVLLQRADPVYIEKPQPTLAPGECWVRAKLVHAQFAYDSTKSVVCFGGESYNVAVPKADVLQGDTPVLGMAAAALDKQCQQVYDLLGVTSQDAAVARIQMLQKLVAAAGPVHATKVSAVPDVANMTLTQRLSIVGPNQQQYGQTYNTWVAGQGWCEPPNTSPSPHSCPTAASEGVLPTAKGANPKQPPSAPLTAEQLAKVQVGDYVLVRMPVFAKGGGKISLAYPAGDEDYADDVGAIVGHEPAPPKPVEAGCRATHPTMGQCVVLGVDGGMAWFRLKQTGERDVIEAKYLTRLPEA